MGSIKFLGSCKGVELVKRGKNDNHICFNILTEDDGNWFTSKTPSSSFWIRDLIDQLEEAEKWLNKNAVKEKYGYSFK